jgi:hypothetical protein
MSDQNKKTSGTLLKNPFARAKQKPKPKPRASQKTS